MPLASAVDPFQSPLERVRTTAAPVSDLLRGRAREATADVIYRKRVGADDKRLQKIN